MRPVFDRCRGYRFLFKGSKTGAYLTARRSDGHRVSVGVWSVTEDDEERLDHDMDLDITYTGFRNPFKSCST